MKSASVISNAYIYNYCIRAVLATWALRWSQFSTDKDKRVIDNCVWVVYLLSISRISTSMSLFL